jgi:Protein of unknown function (DUF4058)
LFNPFFLSEFLDMDTHRCLLHSPLARPDKPADPIQRVFDTPFGADFFAEGGGVGVDLRVFQKGVQTRCEIFGGQFGARTVANRKLPTVYEKKWRENAFDFPDIMEGDGRLRNKTMPIHVRENLYRGVNAHLQSKFQSPESDWVGFHDSYVVDLTRAITEKLPPGYYALNEKSLQLLQVESGNKTRTVADIAIIRGTQRSSGIETAAVVDAPAQTVPLLEKLMDEDYLQAVIIYQDRGEDPLIPVTRLELLSSANKPPGSHYEAYIAKRDDTLRGRVNLVEIDFLHEQPSHARDLPSYPDRDPSASPYMMMVNRPFPNYDQGKTDLYPFFVDERIPTIRVPLLGQDFVDVAFGAIYNQTYAANPYYGMVLVDYAKEPVRMETYAPADQERIRARMAASL